MHQQPLIGIMGGVGAGKSTVAAAFGRLGCAVIDADTVAHEVLQQPTVKAAVVSRFGEEMLDASGRIDRRELAQWVFERPEEIAFLNNLVHPRVLSRCNDLIRRYKAKNDVTAIVLDMPLLVEVGWEKKCDFLIFVECARQKRLERTLKNGKISVEQLKKREKFQISLDKKRHIAHYIIHNNSDESDVAEQVAQLFSNLATAKSE